MSDHQCPHDGGLATCPDHPKWHVIGAAERCWLVYGPCGIERDAAFDSWREALNYARNCASRSTGVHHR